MAKLKKFLSKALATFAVFALVSSVFVPLSAIAASKNGQFDAVMPVEIVQVEGQNTYNLVIQPGVTISSGTLATIKSELQAMYTKVYGDTDKIQAMLGELSVLENQIKGMGTSVDSTAYQNAVNAAIERSRELVIDGVIYNVRNGVNKDTYTVIRGQAYSDKYSEIKSNDPVAKALLPNHRRFQGLNPDNGDTLQGMSNPWIELQSLAASHPAMFAGTDGFSSFSTGTFAGVRNTVIANIEAAGYTDAGDIAAAARARALLDQQNSYLSDAIAYEAWQPSAAQLAEINKYADDTMNAAVMADAQGPIDAMNAKLDTAQAEAIAYFNSIKSTIESELSTNKAKALASVDANKKALVKILDEIEADIKSVSDDYEAFLDGSSGITLRIDSTVEGGYTGFKEKALTYRDILDGNFALGNVTISLPDSMFPAAGTAKNVSVKSVLSIVVDANFTLEQFSAKFDGTYTPDLAKIVSTVWSEVDAYFYKDLGSGSYFSADVYDLIDGYYGFNGGLWDLREAQTEEDDNYDLVAKPYVISFDVTTNLPSAVSGEIDEDTDVVKLVALSDDTGNGGDNGDNGGDNGNGGNSGDNGNTGGDNGNTGGNTGDNGNGGNNGNNGNNGTDNGNGNGNVDDSKNPTDPNDSKKPDTTTPIDKLPNTGDNSITWLYWAGGLALLAAIVIGILLYRENRKSDEA